MFGQNIQFQFKTKIKEDNFPDVTVAENSNPPLRPFTLLRVEYADLLEPVLKEQVEVGVTFG